MKRKIIQINEEKCNGCGACASECPEGAIQMIDGKAQIVGEFLCDGLGACISKCPVDAIEIVEKEAEPYNERKVMENLKIKGEKVIFAHLKHLKEHGQFSWLKEAIKYIRENEIKIDIKEFELFLENNSYNKDKNEIEKSVCCEHANSIDYSLNSENSHSELTNWPIQLHLINPMAPYLNDSDLLIAADCTAFSFSNFHSEFLRNKKLIIACPKLDSGKEVYIDKLTYLFSNHKINSITVLIMQVPCCMGLVSLVKEAIERSTANLNIELIILSTDGKILSKKNI